MWVCKFNWTRLLLKWRVSQSTPYPLEQVVHYLDWFKLFINQKARVGGWVWKSGNEPKIVGACCCHGCAQAQNYNIKNQAFWEGECWFRCRATLPSEWFEGVYQNHWMPTTKYQRTIVPCSHHSRTIGAHVTTNSIAYPKGWRSKLHLPLNGQVGRD